MISSKVLQGSDAALHHILKYIDACVIIVYVCTYIAKRIQRHMQDE